MKHVLLVFAFVTSVFCLSAPMGSAQQAAKTVASSVSVVTNTSGYVGSDTCATCHADIATKFSTNLHSKLALMHGGSGATCESCHGPGQAHVESGGDATKLFQFTKATPQQIDKTCLGCHASAHPDFMRSPHAKAGLSCSSCHSVHGLISAAPSVPAVASKASANAQKGSHLSLLAMLKASEGPMNAQPLTPTSFAATSFEVPGNPNLLKAPQPQLCYQCHADVKGSFAMPFHHPVNEGAVKCSDCHNGHGTFLKNNLRSTADQNEICTKCHVETRGPFVFEHAAVKAEGCVGCHTPHGSQNPRLLNMPAINTLCATCHSPVAAGTFHSMNAGSSELTSCTSCHTMIHGSNLNAAFLK